MFKSGAEVGESRTLETGLQFKNSFNQIRPIRGAYNRWSGKWAGGELRDVPIFTICSVRKLDLESCPPLAKNFKSGIIRKDSFFRPSHTQKGFCNGREQTKIQDEY